MSTFMAILAVLLPIAACVFIPIWMKKKSKKNLQKDIQIKAYTTLLDEIRELV